MTARDFTPTDEQIIAFRRGDMSDEAWNALPQSFHDNMMRIYREEFASPAFQSIIAAAKAEALRDLADEYRRSMKFATDHRIDAGLMILHIEKRANEISEASA